MTRRTCLAVAIALAAAGPGLSGPTTRPVDQTEQVSWTWRIRVVVAWNPKYMEVPEATFASILAATRRGRPDLEGSITAIKPVPPPQQRKDIHVGSAAAVGPEWKAVQLTFVGSIPEERFREHLALLEAKKKAEAVAKSLLIHLVNVIGSLEPTERIRRERLGPLEQELARTIAALDRAKNRQARASSLAKGLPELEMHLFGLAARHKALSLRIAKLTAEARDRVKADPVVAELEQILQLRQAALAELKRVAKQGAIPKGDLREAWIKLIEARLRLAQRREEVLANNGQLIQRLTEKLVEGEIEKAELQARLEYARTSLGGAAAFVAKASRELKLVRERREAIHPYAIFKAQTSVSRRLLPQKARRPTASVP